MAFEAVGEGLLRLGLFFFEIALEVCCRGLGWLLIVISTGGRYPKPGHWTAREGGQYLVALSFYVGLAGFLVWYFDVP